MKSIRIENLRSLRDTGVIELKPLTVLVGRNSVGKSTFLRTFPLFKQTVDTRRSEPILWYSENMVDFGTFDDSLNGYVKGISDENTIDFEFNFSLSINEESPFSYFQVYDYLSKKEQKEAVDVSLKIKVGKKYIQECDLRIFDYEFKIKYFEDKKVNLKLNGKDYFAKDITPLFWNNRLNGIIPYIDKKEDTRKKFSYRSSNISDFAKSIIIDKIKNLARRNTSEKNIKYIVDRLIFDNRVNFEKKFFNLISEKNTINKKIGCFNENDRKAYLDDLYCYFGILNLGDLIDSVNFFLSSYFSSVQYIAPIRASAQRYYRIQGIAIDYITAQGENTPMLLRNMKQSNLNEFREWQEWTQKEFSVMFDTEDVGVNVSVYLITNDLKINMADTGFGYSQILPVLLFLWKVKIQQNSRNTKPSWMRNFINTSTLVIEQPELHLHPALQARLLDIFIDIIKYTRDNFDFKIIIETHSETIINRIGYNINVSKSINKEDVNILIFENDKTNDVTIKKAFFDEDGLLANWPLGFFMPDVRGKM